MFDGVKICFVSGGIPRNDVASGALRVLEIMQAMKSFGVYIFYLSYGVNKYKYLVGRLLWIFFSFFSKEAKNYPYITSVFDLKFARFLGKDMPFSRKPLDIPKITEFLSRESFDVLWITEVWTPENMNRMLDLIRLARSAFSSKHGIKIVMDTTDFHAKSWNRKYNVSHKYEDLDMAKRFFESEEKCYPEVDCVITVSPDESRDIKNAIPNSADLYEIGNINRICDISNLNSFMSRKHIVFLGACWNANVDAASYFIREIYPLIHEKNKDIELHIVGSGWPKTLRSGMTEQRGVKLIGYVKDLDLILGQYKMMVVPLTYGTGMKGKIGSAMAVGLPVVTTSIGAEGYPMTDGQEAIIADTPIAFAKACLDLYENETLWNKLSSCGYEMIKRTTSPEEGLKAVSAVLHRVLRYRELGNDRHD
ncbi:hypothetical protein FACS1894187_16580 [Synergistales bacterium]|nr:hypothetical protein FACS1894187_16580 [Synergistales bacterium]